MSIILLENVILFFKGELVFLIGIFLLNSKKLVIVIVGICLFLVKVWGLNVINLLILFK